MYIKASVNSTFEAAQGTGAWIWAQMEADFNYKIYVPECCPIPLVSLAGP